jgi:hypothetical protein
VARTGAKFHGAEWAWVRTPGITGAGESIAIIDTGIFQGNSEFAGRISPNSTDIFSSRGTIEGEDDHGTLVAMVAAAANDGAGTVGIAYGAQIMAIRADEPGTCASSKDCTFGDVAQGITWAADHGAAVINLSLGGERAAADEISAVEYAASKGVVVVVSAGNDGNKTIGKNPDAFPLSFVNDPQNKGNVSIVGSVNAAGQLSGFSNKAGTSPDFYLAALGDKVAVYLDGPQWASDPNCPSPTLCQISGTSFSAPQVAGAVALIKQAFPSLTAAQIVDLLLSTAQDVGAPGVDAIYGHGILNIYEAFQPQGTTMLAGKTAEALPLKQTTAVASPPMGDALAAASVDAIVLDKYSRAFHYNLASQMRSATIRRRLQDAVGTAYRSLAIASGTLAMNFSIDDSRRGAMLQIPGELRLTRDDAQAARVLAARIALKLSPDSQIGFAYAEGADGLIAQLQGQQRPAFMIASRAGEDNAMFERTDVSLAYRKQFGRWGLTFSGQSGETYSGAPLQIAGRRDPEWKTDPVRTFGLALDRTWGALDGTLGISVMDEDRTVLGARFDDAFGGGGAKSLFVDLGAGWNVGDRWRLGAAVRTGWTFADTGNVIAGGSVLRTSAWSFDIERSGVFGASDRLGLRIAQPLRVESGGLNLDLPVAYSYDTQSATMGIERLNLAPSGREVLGEFAWNGPMMGGSASASLFYRRDPGNYAAAPDDKGVVVRWAKGF